jgi:hypothetical protein
VTAHPLLPGRLYGLRTWRVVDSDGHPRLAGPYQNMPWPAAGEAVEAVCADGGAHDAPAHDCQCGVHALHPRRHSARRVLAGRLDVPGVVEAWGDVELHESGFRAAYGRPYALILQPGRNERLIRELAREYKAEVIELRKPAELLDHCRRRELGLEEHVVDELLAPGHAQQRRRARRRQARTNVLRVAAAVIIGLVMFALGQQLFEDPHGPEVLSGRTGAITVNH